MVAQRHVAVLGGLLCLVAMRFASAKPIQDDAIPTELAEDTTESEEELDYEAIRRRTPKLV